MKYERQIETFIAFWLEFMIRQNNLFKDFGKNSIFIMKTLAIKAFNDMVKTLYVTATPRKEGASSEINSESQGTVTFNPETRSLESVPDTKYSSEMNVEGTEIRLKLELPQATDYLNIMSSFHVALIDKLNTILAEIKTLQERTNNMALNLDMLTAEVARVKTVQDSAITLLRRLADELHNVADDPSAVNELANQLKNSTDALAAAVADSAGVVPQKSVIVNADDPAVPTVEVVMPEVLPEVVEAKVEQIVETVDPTSPEPQFTITVEEAAPAVVEAVEAAPAEVVASPTETISTSEGEMATTVMETDAGQVDVVVTAPVEEVAEAKAEGVDVLATVQEAFESTPEVTAEAEVPVTE